MFENGDLLSYYQPACVHETVEADDNQMAPIYPMTQHNVYEERVRKAMLQ